MSKFVPGEIAIYCPPPGIHENWRGLEVTVLGVNVEETRSDNAGNIYDIQASWCSYPSCVGEYCLRKRRPPPDWNALLSSKPRDVETCPTGAT